MMKCEYLLPCRLIPLFWLEFLCQYEEKLLKVLILHYNSPYISSDAFLSKSKETKVYKYVQIIGKVICQYLLVVLFWSFLLDIAFSSICLSLIDKELKIRPKKEKTCLWWSSKHIGRDFNFVDKTSKQHVLRWCRHSRI